MKWAKPDETHLSKLLREVHDRPGAARKKGLRARQDVVAMYSNAAVAERILQRLQEVQARLARAALPPAPPLDYQFQWCARCARCTGCLRVGRAGVVPAFVVGPGRLTSVRRSRRRTVASDVKLCASMRSTKRTAPPSSPPPAPPTRLADICGSSRHARLAFITPFPPRHDGLAQHAANLRTALLTRCANLQIDVFALVLDFWNGESEAYDASIGACVPGSRRAMHACACPTHRPPLPTSCLPVHVRPVHRWRRGTQPNMHPIPPPHPTVKHTICRESYSDYEAAARLINEHYDLALLNFKLGARGVCVWGGGGGGHSGSPCVRRLDRLRALRAHPRAGALGGTQCVFAACFAKLLEKPLATVVHSVTHNLDDPLQARQQQPQRLAGRPAGGRSDR